METPLKMQNGRNKIVIIGNKAKQMKINGSDVSKRGRWCRARERGGQCLTLNIGCCAVTACKQGFK
jgi:hypothetical protein